MRNAEAALDRRVTIGQRNTAEAIVGNDGGTAGYGQAIGGSVLRKRRRGNQCAGGKRRSERDLGDRSEEHTSELQSLMRISYAVFCLKKKKKQHKQHKQINTHDYSTCANPP